jgi:acyl-CoA thioesterase
MTTASSEFDRAVALRTAAVGSAVADLSPEWNVGAAPNGGYLVCLALSGLAAALPHPDPFAVTAHFPLRAEVGPATVETELIRKGFTLSTGAARLVQNGHTRVHVTATFGDLSTQEGPTAVQAELPPMAPPDACVRADAELAGEFLRRFDLRLTPESAAWARGRPSGVAEIAGWIRFADGRPPDVASLPLFADAFPPTAFNVVDEVRWVPTLELTVHVRGRPADGWLRCRFRTRFLIDGYLEEDGELWDSTGRLVALSRQMARIQRAI